MRWADRFADMHTAASERAGGMRDFGDDGYHEGLRALLDALDADPPAAPAMPENLIVATLAARLHTEAQWRENPGFRSRDIARPLVVIGVPRTGTTALHNLLGQDPQFQGIEKWLCFAPLVRPAPADRDAHPQFRACAEQTAQLFALAPDVMAAHGIRADDVDECLVPMAQSFCSNWFPSQLDLPRYDAWFGEADETPSFRRYKDVLRLVGLADDRRWLLKNPSNVFGVDALLAAFPDACVVQTHRNPLASLASLVSLLGNIMIAYTGSDIDRPRRLARETAFWAEAVRRTMAAQARTPERFVNVLQPDIRRDPIGVVRRIYDHFGFELSAAAERRMGDWAAANADTSAGRHDYVGVADEAPIRAAFADYMDRFGFA